MASGALPLEAPIDLPAAHIAAGKNQTEKLARLIEEEKKAAVDPNTKETILHAAARNGAIKTTKWMVDSKVVDCLAYAKNGYTAAHYAALYGHLGVLKILLTQDDRQLESKLIKQTTRGDENLSVLCLAAIGGYKDIVEWLLNNFGAKADVPTSKGRHSAHFAAAYGKLDVLTLLVDILGEEVAHMKDDQNTTPVFLAAQQGHLGVLSYLVNDLGADAEAQDKEGFNSVHAATQAEQAQCVKWLVAKLGSRYIISKTGKDGATPLHMAAASGNLDILRYFLDTLDDDVNVTDHSSFTPLHDAAEEGVVQAVQLLLKHGAKADVKNKEQQTPYDLAMESGHADVAALIRDHTLSRKSKPQDEKAKLGPRTSREVTEELSSAIQQQAEVLEQRKEKQLSRQASLQDLEHDDASTKDTLPLIAKKSEDDDDEIEHTLGPKGDLYANPKKLATKPKKKVPPANDYDIEGFSSDPQSLKHQRQSSRPANYDYDNEGPYAVINDSASLISRDRRSRVKRHYGGQDTDSDISGVTGRSGRRGHHHMPGWYPGAYEPVMFKRRGPRSVASSKHSSKEGSQHSGYPPMMAPIGYGYPYFAPGMPYPQYWPHPQAPYGMSPDGQMPAPMIAPGMGYGVIPHHRMHPQRPATKQQKKKGKGSRHHKPHDNLSAESSGFFGAKKHTDQDIGYGPSIETPSAIREDDIHDHPLAPPVTSPEGFMDEAADVSKFSSNIIMSRKSDQVREVEGLTLNPSKAAPEVYDGRYDEYIMNDSDYEYEPEDYMNVGLLAEAAAILAIGCVAGLKGLGRIRKKNSSSIVVDKHHSSDRYGLSSAWDDTHAYDHSPRKRRGSMDENLRGMSPEEFANVEDLERQTWTKDKPKAKKAKQEAPKKEKEKTKKNVPVNEPEVFNELITPELHKESFQSVSKHLGQKILGDALGAMHSSMLQIAPSSGMGSHMSLTMTSEEERERDDDDDFGDTISLLEGKTPGAGPSGRKRKTGVDDTASGTEQSKVNTDAESEVAVGKSSKKKKDKEKKEKRGKTKEKKEKEKKEKKSKKVSKKEKKDKKDGEATTPDKSAIKEGAYSLDKTPATDVQSQPKTLESEPKTMEPEPKALEPEPKKIKAQNLMQTPSVEPDSVEPAAPVTPVAPRAKKVYPKEKHPKVTKSPKFGQRLLVSAPTKAVEKQPTKPEAEEKTREQKGSDTKPEVTKPVERVTAPPKKAPQPPVERAPPKPKENIPTKAPATKVATKPQTAAKVPVKTISPPKKDETSSSREVINDVSKFDVESSEDEEIPLAHVAKPKPTFIDDDFSREIFGDDQLAELNEALRELEDIQFSITTDLQMASTQTTSNATKPTAPSGGESKRKGQQETFMAGSSAKQKKEKSASRTEEALFSYEDGELDLSDEDDIPSIPSSVQLSNGINATFTVTQQQPSSRKTSTSRQTSGLAVHSTGVQGDGSYTSPFESNVLSILQGLNETMQQMKNNPSVSQTEINQHELLQQEMIQNLIAFSQQDPNVLQKLLALLKDQQSPSGADNSGALEDLQQKLIEAQERQRREASEHFRSQEEFHQEMKRSLQETAQMQMKGIQSNFDKYTKMMSEQMAEQMRRWEADMKKREKELEKKERESKKSRSKNKKKKHRKHHYSSDTGSSSGSEIESSGLIQPSAKVFVATKPAIKTDTAMIVRQDLLDDDMRTSSMPKMLAEKRQQMMKRRDTKVNFDHSREALKRFESTSEPSTQEPVDGFDDSEQEEEEEMQFQHARPVTLKRADIKKQPQNTGYTPHRPQNAHQAVAEKRVVPVKGEERPEHSQVAGAGEELAAFLKRQRQ